MTTIEKSTIPGYYRLKTKGVSTLWPEAVPLGRALEQHLFAVAAEDRGPRCCVCHVSRVDAEGGYDTCEECLRRQ